MFYKHHDLTDHLRDALEWLMVKRLELDEPFQNAWSRLERDTASVCVCYENEDLARENKGKFSLTVDSRVGHIMSHDTLRFFAGFLSAFVNEKMNPCELMTPDDLRIVGGDKGTFILLMDGVRYGAKPDDYDRRHEEYCLELFQKTKADRATDSVVEISALIADDPDYESVWQPRLNELLDFVKWRGGE